MEVVFTMTTKKTMMTMKIQKTKILIQLSQALNGSQATSEQTNFRFTRYANASKN